MAVTAAATAPAAGRAAESAAAVGTGARWALIDARPVAGAEVQATTRLAGLPQLCRHLRMAARQGWAGAVILVGQGEARTTVERAVAKAPPPAGFTVELAEAEADAAPPGGRTYVPLDGRAVYAADALAAAARDGGPPTALATLETRADLRLADRRLYRSLRKSIELDGVVAYYAMRPISQRITRILINTPVTPNQVTMVVLLSGLLGGWLAGQGGYTMCAIAGLVYWFGTVVDCVDGELARLRVKGSRIGEWLDTIADDITTYGLLAGLGVGLAHDGAGDYWFWMGVIGAVGGVLIKAVMYGDLHRQRLPIDIAAYPWFFGDPTKPANARSKTVLGTIWYGIEYLFRRDGYCTVVAIALLLGGRKLAAAGLFVGGLVPGPVLLLHFVVMAFRGKKQPAASA